MGSNKQQLDEQRNNRMRETGARSHEATPLFTREIKREGKREEVRSRSTYKERATVIYGPGTHTSTSPEAKVRQCLTLCQLRGRDLQLRRYCFGGQSWTLLLWARPLRWRHGGQNRLLLLLFPPRNREVSSRCCCPGETAGGDRLRVFPRTTRLSCAPDRRIHQRAAAKAWCGLVWLGVAWPHAECPTMGLVAAVSKYAEGGHDVA